GAGRHPGGEAGTGRIGKGRPGGCPDAGRQGGAGATGTAEVIARPARGRVLALASPSRAWGREGEKLRFSAGVGLEAELRGLRSQAELGNEVMAEVVAAAWHAGDALRLGPPWGMPRMPPTPSQSFHFSKKNVVLPRPPCAP